MPRGEVANSLQTIRRTAVSGSGEDEGKELARQNKHRGSWTAHPTRKRPQAARAL